MAEARVPVAPVPGAASSCGYHTDIEHVSKRRNAPLSARSVLLSMLLGNVPPRAPARQLVRTAELFGITEGATRTALSRLTAAGEVAVADGSYEIRDERLLARQRRQARSRAAVTVPWDGRSWTVAVVVAPARRPPDRRALVRRRLGEARLAELREGVWLRPDNLGSEVIDDDHLVWMRAEPEGDPGALAARLWDLASWVDESRDLIGAMDELLPDLRRQDQRVLAAGFVTSADVLRHLQADPLLPPELLPPDWPGPALRARYDEYDAAYRATLRTWFQHHEVGNGAPAGQVPGDTSGLTE